MRASLKQWIAVGAALAALGCAAEEDAPATSNDATEPTVVVYEVTFEASWPSGDAPDGTHFSPLVAVTHAADAPPWQLGDAASDGLRELATEGNPAGLEDELNEAKASGNVCGLTIGAGLTEPTGAVTLTVSTDARCPALSLAAMVGPSDDTLVTVTAQLRQGDDWAPSVTPAVQLVDAGVAEGDALDAFAGLTASVSITRLSTRCQDLNNLPAEADPSITSVRATAYPGNVLRQTVTFETAEAADAWVLFWAEGDEQARVSPVSEDATEHDVVLYGLLPETEYHFAVATFAGDRPSVSETGGFTTGALPPDVPQFELISSVDDAIDSFYQNVAHQGFTLVNYVGPVAEERTHTAFVILDAEARVVWYEQVPIVAPWQLAKFEWTDERTLVVIQNAGEIRELTLGGQVLREVTVEEDLPLHHEIFVNEDDHFVTLTTVHHEVDLSGSGGAADTLYEGDGILVTDETGTPLWTWTSFDHLDPVAEAHGNAQDDGSFRWLNANALAVDTDGNYLVSLRLASQVIKVDSTTGEIIWRLGGENSDFTLGEGAEFIRQHHLTMLEGRRLLMFDNGNPARGWSRALELQLDETDMTARLQWEYQLPEALFSAGVSGATRLDNGNTLIVSGRTTTILNVTRQKEVVWQASGPEGAAYRAFPVTLDTCEPVRPPTVN